MQEFFVAFIFGFGLVSVSLILSAIGITKDKPWLVILGAILFTPFAYYLFGASSANGLTLVPPLMLIVSAAALREKNKLWAWILLAPAVLEVLWVLGVALFYGLR